MDSRKDWPLMVSFFMGPDIFTDSSLMVPMAMEVCAKAFCSFLPPMPALTTEFQSCKPTLPEDMA
jgi:hypothetical protein